MNKNKKLPAINEPVERCFPLVDIRAAVENETDSIIDGHAAVFGQKANIYEMFYEVIERGAFDECDFTDVLFCINHDTQKIPLARSRNNTKNSTMQLSVDDRGLYVRANVDTENNVEAKALHSSVGRGDIDGMSFIFYVKEERWEDLDKDMPTRHVLKVRKVREVTAASLPFYTGTDINARGQAVLDNAARVLDNARSTLDSEKNELEALRLKAKIKAKG